MWLQMADWIKRGGALPYSPTLLSELTTPTYTFINGKFALEEKDMIKKRLGRSTDEGDGLGLTFAIPDLPAKEMLQQQYESAFKNKNKSEYDPFSDERMNS